MNIDIITIRYTKSTDIAGSGIWTPSGIPAVHYSTEEQVVGTWIDGKTLYQKTITSSDAISFNNWGNIVDVSSLNIDEFVEVDVRVRVNEDGDTVFRDYSAGTNLSVMYNESTGYLIGRQSIVSTVSGTTWYCVYTIRYTKSAS